MPRPNPEDKKSHNLWQSRSSTDPVWSVNYSDDLLYYRSWSGTNSPGFPEILVVNPHSTATQWARRDVCVGSWRQSSSNWSEYRGPGNHCHMGQAPDPTLSSLADISMTADAERVCKSRLITKVSRQKVNIAQNIGEFRQVQSMFLSNTKRIVGAYRALRHGDPMGVARNLALSKRQTKRVARLDPKSLARNPASWWLELQYGWRPLVGDVYDGLTQFYSRVEQGATIGDVAHKSFKWDVYVPTVNVNSYVKYSEAVSRKAACKMGIRYRVDNSRLANLQDWGITNPLLLAWELMPYSFVVDWFIPVGNWLENVNYSLGLSFEDGYKSLFVKGESMRILRAGTPPTGFSHYKWNYKGVERFGGARFIRTKLNSFPVSPSPFTFDKGGIKKGYRIQNAIALLTNVFMKR